MKTLPITGIRLDGGTQVRATLDVATVADYAARMSEGDVFPAVVVFYDGTDHWLADGFHRIAAAERNGTTEIAADVRNGALRDAVLFGVGANVKNGLRLTNADKRKAVLALLADEEWAKWSDRGIARRAGVTHPFVAKLRAGLGGNGYHAEAEADNDLAEFLAEGEKLTAKLGLPHFFHSEKAILFLERNGRWLFTAEVYPAVQGPHNFWIRIVDFRAESSHPDGAGGTEITTRKPVPEWAIAATFDSAGWCGNGEIKVYTRPTEPFDAMPAMSLAWVSP